MKAVFCDINGVLFEQEVRFSEKYCHDFGLKMEVMNEFFDGAFDLCLTGKADLKEELVKLTEKWRWKGSVEKLIEYWFESGAKPHYKLMDYLAGLRAAGIKLYLSTQNEKYQTANFIKKLKPLMKYDGVITTCEVGYKKSNPKFFGEALKITGVKAENAIVIDNNQKAIAAAELCGIKTVFFENESQSIAALGAILE